VLDICSGRVIGFALGEHHDTDLAYAALTVAVAVRSGDVAGVTLHTDRGSDSPHGRFAGPAPGCGSASRWDDPAQRWTTPPSRAGTPRSSSSSSTWSTSPPRPRPGGRWPRSSRGKTPNGSTRRCRCGHPSASNTTITTPATTIRCRHAPPEGNEHQRLPASWVWEPGTDGLRHRSIHLGCGYGRWAGAGPHPPGWCWFPLRGYQRTLRKVSRTSPTMASGFSKWAKWPPLGWAFTLTTLNVLRVGPFSKAAMRPSMVVTPGG
jgi:hypothetical protein